MTENTAQEIRNCQCAMYFAVTAEWNNDNGEPDETTDETGCTATTTRDFAPGHDAKLKSHLIRWGAAGYEVAFVEGGTRVGTDAQNVANRYGFGHMVAAGIAKAQAKAAERQAKADAKHAAKAAKAPAPAPEATPDPEPAPEAEPLPVPAQAKAKVGRWTYEGTVNVDGTFTYSAKLGGTKTAEAGTFTVLDA